MSNGVAERLRRFAPQGMERLSGTANTLKRNNTCDIFTTHIFWLKLYIMDRKRRLHVAETTNLSIRMDEV